jgi:hypothetical protein
MAATGGHCFDARAGTSRRDQLQTLADADELPITYLPFKFESRPSRIDWRLLHGVDINKLVGNGPEHTTVSCMPGVSEHNQRALRVSRQQHTNTMLHANLPNIHIAA